MKINELPHVLTHMKKNVCELITNYRTFFELTHIVFCEYLNTIFYMYLGNYLTYILGCVKVENLREKEQKRGIYPQCEVLIVRY